MGGSFCASGGEKIVQKTTAFFAAETACDLNAVIHACPVANVPSGADSACSFVVFSVKQVANAGIHDGAGTHRTWLYGNIKCRIRQTPTVETGGGVAEDENFGVCRRIVMLFAAIVIGCDEKTAPDEYGTDGNFSFGFRFFGFRYRQ